MRILAVSEYWFPPLAHGLDAPSAMVSELARQGHVVHLLSAKAMLEDGDVPRGLTLELWPELYAGHDGEIRSFVDWAKAKLAGLSQTYDAVVSFCPWVAAPAMVLGYPLAAQAKRDDGPTRGARDRLMKWALGAWHPRYRFLGRLESQGVGDSSVRQRGVLGESVKRAWQRTLKLSDEGWRCLPMASTGPRLAGGDRLAARQRIRQAFAVDKDSLVFAAWVNQPKADETEPLLQAFSELISSPERRKAILFLAGELGYAQQKQAADRGIRQSVRFIGWTARASELWAASDIVIQLWPRDGTGGPAIEALGLGIAAIWPGDDLILKRFFDSSDSTESVQSGQHRMTSASIANAMKWMMQDDHRRQAIQYAQISANRLKIEDQVRELAAWLSQSSRGQSTK